MNNVKIFALDWANWGLHFIWVRVCGRSTTSLFLLLI